MNRRQFTKRIVAGGILAALSRPEILRADERPQVGITIDDFNVFDTPVLTGLERNQAMLDAIRQHRNLKAAVFVTGRYVDNATVMPMLRQWDEEGHTIGNHTYSHGYYPGADFRQYTRDILRNEGLLHEFPMYRRLFRFPYLKEGNTAEQRDLMRAFLREHGYQNGHVTIDASDWYVDGRLRRRLEQDPGADLAPYRDYYLQHLWDRAQYYDGLARKVLGRSVKHTLLLHHNVLNGLFLGDVLNLFERNGWQLIDASEAYSDPIFTEEPDVVPAGESLIRALAKETGRFESVLRYPAEDGRYEAPKMDSLGL